MKSIKQAMREEAAAYEDGRVAQLPLPVEEARERSIWWRSTARPRLRSSSRRRWRSHGPCIWPQRWPQASMSHVQEQLNLCLARIKRCL